MARNPEDERFLEERDLLAPLAEPPATLPPTQEELVQAAMGQPAPDPDVLPVQTIPPESPPPPKPVLPPYGKGADKAALDAAIASRGQNDAAASLETASSLFNKAGGGHAGDLAAPVRAQRDDAFNDVMRKRALADQDAGAIKRQRDAELDAAKRDYQTDVSANARNLLLGSRLGQAFKSRMGDKFDLLSAAQLEPILGHIAASETDLLKADAKAGNGDDGRGGALEALVAAAGGVESPRGQFFSDAFKNAPLKVIQKQGFDLLTREEKQKFDEKMQGVRDTAAKERARIMAGTNVEKEIRGDRSELSKTLDKAGGFFPNLRTVEGIISKHLDSKGNVTDLPTVGPLDKPVTDFWGGILRSKEGQELAKAADQIQLSYRNLVTGSAASTEEDRRIAAAGLDRRNLQGFLTGLKLMKGRYQDLLKRTYAGYEPEVAQGYIARNPDYGLQGDETYDPTRAKEAFSRYQNASQAQHIIPGRTPPAAPPIPTSQPVRLRYNGKLWEEGPDGEAIEVEE